MFNDIYFVRRNKNQILLYVPYYGRRHIPKTKISEGKQKKKGISNGLTFLLFHKIVFYILELIGITNISNIEV